jgi:hypothetical protein
MATKVMRCFPNRNERGRRRALGRRPVQIFQAPRATRSSSVVDAITQNLVSDRCDTVGAFERRFGCERDHACAFRSSDDDRAFVRLNGQRSQAPAFAVLAEALRYRDGSHRVDTKIPM